jgi:hypothetical protein
MHEVIGYGGDVDYSSDEEEDDRSEKLNSSKNFIVICFIIAERIVYNFYYDVA